MLNSPNGMFSAWITVEGAETPEYHVETSADQKVVTCWIASETGKRFAIHWKNFAYAADAAGDIELDGTFVYGKFLYGTKLPVSTSQVGVREGEMIRPFVFSSLTTTDDDDYLGRSSSDKLGTIELSIYPIKVYEQKFKKRNSVTLDNITVHERNKKAVTQRIALGALQHPEKKLKPFHKTHRVGPPLVQFCFKYRPLDVLQANGIAPAPAPRTSKRKASPESDDDRSDEEELKVMRNKVNALESKLLKKGKNKRVKVEGDGGVIDLTEEPRRNNKKMVKTEGSWASAEVIDLT